MVAKSPNLKINIQTSQNFQLKRNPQTKHASPPSFQEWHSHGNFFIQENKLPPGKNNRDLITLTS